MPWKQIAASPQLAGGVHRYMGPQSTTYVTPHHAEDNLSLLPKPERRDIATMTTMKEQEEAEGNDTPEKVLEEPEQMCKAGWIVKTIESQNSFG